MSLRVGVVVECDRDEVVTATWEALACARSITEGDMGVIRLLVPGKRGSALASELAAATGLKVIGVEWSDGDVFNGGGYRRALTEVLAAAGLTHLVVAGTSRGLDYAPGLSLRWQAACITGVEKVRLDAGRPVYSRAVHGGKIIAELSTVAEKTVVVTQPGTFVPFIPTAAVPGEVDVFEATEADEPTWNLGIKPVESVNVDLQQAAVVVSAGRGIGEAGNLDLIYRLAAVFDNAAIAGSRPLIDLGWMPSRRQVGLTGTMVAPDLYIACGISGATQHIGGMRNAGFIVAVNTDPQAAIFNIADICVVADLTVFIPAFLDVVAAYRRKGG